MKKLSILILVLVFAGSLSGCNEKTPEVTFYTVPTHETTQASTESMPQQTAPNTEYQTDLIAVALPCSNQEHKDDHSTQISRYESQSMTLYHSNAAAADKITSDFQARQNRFQSDAQRLMNQAENDFTGKDHWSAYYYAVSYAPTRVDETVLSLFGSKISWSGASHPERTCIFANYNMLTGDVLTLGSILVHEDQIQTLSSLLLEELKQIETEKSLFSGYETTVSARFGRSVSYDESWYFNRNGLCFAFSPYEIAPYSQGVISVTIPYEKLTGVIDDNYFPGERDTSIGPVTLSWPTEQELDALSAQPIAQVVLDQQGQMLLLNAEKQVYDVRLELGKWDKNGNPSATCYTVFGTDDLANQTAVLVQADLIPDGLYLRLSYLQGDQTVYEYITAVDSD